MGKLVILLLEVIFLKSLIGDKIEKDILFREIIKKHYSLLEFESKNKINIKNIIKKIFNNIDKKITELASLYEYWEYEERQSKFIIGGQKVYEFYDLQELLSELFICKFLEKCSI